MKKAIVSLLFTLMLCAYCAAVAADKSPLAQIIGKWTSNNTVRKIGLEVNNVDAADGNKYRIDDEIKYSDSISFYYSPNGTIIALHEYGVLGTSSETKIAYNVYLSDNNNTMLWISEASQNSNGKLYITSFSRE